MKKLLTFALTLALVSCLASCNNSNNESSKTAELEKRVADLESQISEQSTTTTTTASTTTKKSTTTSTTTTTKKSTTTSMTTTTATTTPETTTTTAQTFDTTSESNMVSIDLPEMYYFDTEAHIVHKDGCELITSHTDFVYTGDLNYALSHGCQKCELCFNN